MNIYSTGIESFHDQNFDTVMSIHNIDSNPENYTFLHIQNGMSTEGKHNALKTSSIRTIFFASSYKVILA